MSWITIIWSMAAAAALTLGCIHLAVWLRERKALASLMFSLVAFSVAAMAPTEVGMMHSATPKEWAQWVQWFHVPLAFAIVGTLAFVRLYLGTGKPWLAWTIAVIRWLILIGNFLQPPNFTYREVSSLARLPFLGEQVATAGDVVLSPWQWLASCSVLLFCVFVIDAALERWRRSTGERRRRAVVVGGSVAAFVLLSIGQTQLTVWGVIRMPVLMSPPFLILLAVMAAETGRDLLLGSRAQQESQQLRNELARASRVTTLGQLASALAHELRQPLGAILRNVETAEMLLKTGAPNLKALRNIIADIHRDDRRAGAVISRLRASIERRRVDAQPVSVGEIVGDTVALVRSEAASRGVTIECRVPTSLPAIMGDRVQLSQVLLNLVLNALDAAQAPSEGQRRVVVAVQGAPGEMLEIAVSDSGGGVPAELRERIFDPFFTTKADGMGMGLPISRGIIEAHGGRLWVDTHESQGACFRFALPLASPPRAQPSSSGLRVRLERTFSR